MTRYPVDPERVSVAGLSSGGEAALELAAARPGQVAVAVAACVSAVPAEPCRLRGVAVRLFHNAGDGRIPVRTARRAHRDLLDCGVESHLTIYPAEGHDAWTAAFGSRELYDFLSTRRRAAGAALPPRRS